ncbi:MAG: hypothetical protein IJH42_01555, partial [Atopobiaceae bacterium]|nr:hypothetical protein [Atopobiaceae bacterium]
VGVSGVVAVTYFRTSTIARILAGSAIDADGTVSVIADSAERIDTDMLGISGAGQAAVSGAIATVITNVTVKAIVGTEDGQAAVETRIGSAGRKAGGLKAIASDDYTLLGISGTVAVGQAGVGVTAIVSISNNTIEAYLGKSTKAFCSGDVEVSATGYRDVQMYLATIGGGQAGVGVVVLVSVTGGGLDQDSANALAAEGDALVCGQQEKPGGHQHTDDCYVKDAHYFDPKALWESLKTSLFGDGDENPDLIGSSTPVGAAVSDKLGSDDDFAALFAGDGTSHADPVSNEDFQAKVEFVVEPHSQIPNGKSPKDLGLYELVNGEYVYSDDASVASGTTYYRCCPLPESLVKVGEPNADDLSTYYEERNGHYYLTTDTSLKSGKSYYVLDTGYADGTAASTDVFRDSAPSTGTYTDVPVITGEDAARAYIAMGSEVTAHDITVAAKSHLLLDLMAFSVAGGQVGVATTIAVGVTYSHAVAYTEAGSTLTATGAVKVTSWTGTERIDPRTEDEEALNGEFSSNVSDNADTDGLGNV